MSCGGTNIHQSVQGIFYTTDPALQAVLLETEADILRPNNDHSSSECSECSSDSGDESDVELTNDGASLEAPECADERESTDYDEESVLENLVDHYYQRKLGQAGGMLFSGHSS